MTQQKRHMDWLRRNGPTIALITSLGAGLVAATWVVAKATFQSQVVAMEKELEFYRSTKNIDIPSLLDDFNKFVGSANAELELRELQGEYEKLREEYEKLNNSYKTLKQTITLKEQFILAQGQTHTVLNGRTIIGLQDLTDSYVNATFDGSNEIGWDIGEFKDVELGGIQYRIVLEEILKTNPPTAKFRVDELPTTTQ